MSSAAIALAVTAAFAQAPDGPPRFEVASIKPSAPDSRGSSIQRGAGRFTTENATLKSLVMMAYNLRSHQLVGGPAWMDDAGFDIAAKPDRPIAKGPAGGETFRIMLRALLAERFHLEVHSETRELPVYALIVAKNGPKLSEAAQENKGSGFSTNNGLMKATRVTMDAVARNLSNRVDRPVIDQTGLTGEYDFRLEFAPAVSLATLQKEGAPDTDRPELFTALQEQLGLKLEPRKAAVETIVIDRAEKPSEN